MKYGEEKRGKLLLLPPVALRLFITSMKQLVALFADGIVHFFRAVIKYNFDS